VTGPEPSLPDKVLAIDAALDGIAHAFGGALALGYYAEPRSTVDVDLNVFVAPDESQAVLDRLEYIGVEVAGAEPGVASDGQVRVWWGRTPLDLFFSYDRFHDAAAVAVVDQPFAGGTVPVLAVEHLVVCKVVFDRPKDWVDLDAIIERGTAIDAAEVLRWVGRFLGDDDPRYERVARVLSA
jgi:hypothetical protein